jgi:hypothetical protein
MCQLVFDVQVPVPSVYNYEFAVGFAIRIHTVAEPAESVRNLSEPGSLLLPRYFLDILDCIEGEVDAERR